MMKSLRFVLMAAAILFQFTLQAQPGRTLVNIVIAPDRAGWNYTPGERVKFSVTVLENGSPVRDAVVLYAVGPEMMPPEKKDSLRLPDGKLTIDGGTMKSPGFLRCEVRARMGGKEYRQVATAGFAPQSIRPAAEAPKDFTAFWDKARAELAAVPVDARMTLLPEKCTDKVNVYQVRVRNFPNGSYVYGMLAVPSKPGKYPALLRVPGAGVYAHGPDIALAETGLITFVIGIHGIPLDMETHVYGNLSAGVLRGYPEIFMENADRFYYKRVYLGCVRANDFLVSLPEFDGRNLGVVGGSQGGALSIVTAALDNRVQYLGAYYPALCDLTGYLKGRAGGWPHYFRNTGAPAAATGASAADKAVQALRINTSGYYDVVNFARVLKVPGIYSWGYNDEVCPPTSMHAAYNVIGAPKELFLALETGHWIYPEQRERVEGWLTGKLKGK